MEKAVGFGEKERIDGRLHPSKESIIYLTNCVGRNS